VISIAEVAYAAMLFNRWFGAFGFVCYGPFGFLLQWFQAFSVFTTSLVNMPMALLLGAGLG